MNFNIFFTHNCNLRCHYCYEENKKTFVSMKDETLEKVLEYISAFIDKNPDEKISILTHGGEPLLEFSKIRRFVESIHQKKADVRLDMTTNGILVTEEIAQFLSMHFTNVSISIDGTKDAHNINRISKNRKDTFDIVQKKALLMLKYMPDLKARMTVTGNNVQYLFEGIKCLLDYGFVNILPVPDISPNIWDEEKSNLLLEQGKLIIDYIREKEIKANIGFVDDALVKCKNANCDGGIGTISIDSNGYIYPCIIAVGSDEFKIGNVWKGINKETLQFIQNECNRKVQVCEGCGRYDYCIATRCLIINKVYTNDFILPLYDTCKIENIKTKLAVYYQTQMQS